MTNKETLFNLQMTVHMSMFGVIVNSMFGVISNWKKIYLYLCSTSGKYRHKEENLST